MTRAARIAQLARVAAIRRELEMAALRRAADARNAAADRVALIDAERAAARAVLAAEPSAALGRQAERFDRWADAERARRNMELARLTADWMDSRATAARAHGQGEVLDRLADRARSEARAEAARRQLATRPADLP